MLTVELIIFVCMGSLMLVIDKLELAFLGVEFLGQFGLKHCFELLGSIDHVNEVHFDRGSSDLLGLRLGDLRNLARVDSY